MINIYLKEYQEICLKDYRVNEFAIYPLFNIIYSCMIKYWCRIISGTKIVRLNVA